MGAALPECKARKPRRVLQTALCAVLLVTLATGCGASKKRVRERIGDLKAQATELEISITEKEAQLERVNQDIEQARKDLEEAKREAEHAKCCAEKQRIIAYILQNKTECAKQIATQEVCLAKNEGRTAKGGFIGCLLGLGVAAASAGIGTPAALAGCGGGLAVGAAAGKKCPTPECAKQFDQIVEQTMKALGYEEWPQCGCEPIPIEALQGDAQN